MIFRRTLFAIALLFWMGALFVQADELKLSPPNLSQPETIVRLPGPIEDIEVGAGGRLLILHLKSLQQLAVFDVSLAKVVKYIPLPSNDVSYAAGARKLYIGIRDDQKIRRFDLSNCKEEKSTSVPIGGIGRLAIGATSVAPLFLFSERDARKSWVIDPATMKAKPMSWEGWRGGAWGPTDASVSFDGSTIAVAGGGWAGIEIASIGKRQVTSSATGSYTRGTPLLAGNGALVFTGDQKIVRRDLASEVKTIEGTPFPALDTNYSLALRTYKGESSLTVFTNGDPKRLFEIRDIPELNTKSRLPLHQRVMLIPAAEVLVTVGEGSDHLILRPFDLAGSLEQADIDYLFVESSPGPSVVKGRRYEYQINVRSRAGNVKLSLESGPKKMALSESGELTWDVPPSFKNDSVSVIIQITDDSNQTAFHTFRIAVD